MTLPSINESKLVSCTFLGCAVRGGVAPTFRDYLLRVEEALRKEHIASGSQIPFGVWHGIYSVGGWRKGAGWHGAGLAIDLNYTTNGYAPCRSGTTLGGEAGANKIKQTRVAFFDAADRACAKANVSCDLAWRKTGESTASVYDRWFAVSEAIKAYLAPYYDPKPKVVEAAMPVLSGVTVPPHIALDFDALRIPLVIGMPSLKPAKTRNPARGLMDIPKHVFVAFRQERGCRLGLADLGSESGDIMHLDRPDLASTVPR